MTVEGTRLRIPALAVESLAVRVVGEDDTIDPRGYVVSYAYTAPGAAPAGGDWVTTSWAVGGPPYRMLIPSPGVAGTKRLWVRVLAGAETVVRLVGLVEAF